MFRSVMVQLTVVMLLWCCSFIIGYSVSVPTNEELLDNACNLIANKSMRDEFKKTVQDDTVLDGSVVLSLNGGYSRSIIGDSLILRPHDQANYNDIDQCKERSAGAVTWCLNIWHPTESIVACLNSTSQYSSNVAEELGIENDLVYLDSCTAFGDTYHGCLKIKYVRTFHDRSFVSYTVDEGNCVVNSFYNIFVRDRSNAAASLTYSPPHMQYREIGKKVITECNFLGLFDFATWKNSSGDNIYPLQEDPNCTLDSNSSSCNQFNTDLMTAARRKGIRSYVLTSYGHGCDNNQKKYMYLVIDNLQMSDQGSYTCFAVSKSLKVTNYTVTIIPVHPVYDPLIINRNESEVYTNKNDDSFLLVCEVEAGIDTEVYWRLPNGNIPKIDFSADYNQSCDNCNESFLTVFGINKETDEYKIKYYRELVVGDAASSFGVYQCVIKYNMRGEEVKYKFIETTVLHRHTRPDGTVITAATTNTAAIITNTRTTTGINTGASISSSIVTTIFVSATSVIKSPIAPTVNRPNNNRGDNDGSVLLVFLLGIFAAALLVLFVICITYAVFVVKRRHASQHGSDVKNDKELFSRHNNSYIFKDRKPCGSVFPSTAVNNMFFIENKEIPREKIEFISKIDEGTFGQVMKATLQNGKHKDDQVVAVKMVKDSVFLRVDDLDNIKEELEIMRNIKHHENIVNMIGYCTSPDGPLYIVMEFVPFGNLRDYLRSISPHSPLSNPAHTRVFNTSSTSSSSCSSGYPLLSTLPSHTPLSAQPSEVSTHSYICFSSDNVAPTLCRSPPGNINQSSNASDTSECSPVHTWPINTSIKHTPHQLADINFGKCALEIAEGLRHLQTMNVIHCDLAARNILIAEDFTLKIGDFGMAKILGEHKDYHKRNQKERIPVKWTAPEALESWKYTHKSDIWSYGIVLWEMLTFGNVPYTEIPNRSAWDMMVTYLKDGHRLQQPDNCTQSLYDVMRKCWSLSPDDRPTATELVAIINEQVAPSYQIDLLDQSH